MKRVGHLWEKIFSRENLEKAIYRSARGKKDRPEVIRVLNSIETSIDDIIKIAGDNPDYIMKNDRKFRKRDPGTGKIRVIEPLRFFPDQVIEWAFLQVIEPILYRDVDIGSTCNLKNKGTLFAAQYIKSKTRRDMKASHYVNVNGGHFKPSCSWCYKDDFKKFFDTIPTYLIEEALHKRIKDERVVTFLINQYRQREHGVYIGRLLSQHLSSLVLHDFDHYLREKVKVGGYSRYCDDIVILMSSKAEAKRAMNAAHKWAEDHGLKLAKPQIYKVQEYDEIKRTPVFAGYYKPFGKFKITVGKSVSEEKIRSDVLSVIRRLSGSFAIDEHDIACANRTILFYTKRVSNHVDLKRIKAAIKKEIKEVKSVTATLQCNRMIDYCGYRIGPVHTNIRKRNKNHIIRLARELRKDILSDKNCAAMSSYWGIITHSDTRGSFWDKHLYGIKRDVVYSINRRNSLKTCGQNYIKKETIHEEDRNFFNRRAINSHRRR